MTDKEMGEMWECDRSGGAGRRIIIRLALQVCRPLRRGWLLRAWTRLEEEWQPDTTLQIRLEL